MRRGEGGGDTCDLAETWYEVVGEGLLGLSFEFDALNERLIRVDVADMVDFSVVVEVGYFVACPVLECVSGVHVPFDGVDAVEFAVVGGDDCVADEAGEVAFVAEFREGL